MKRLIVFADGTWNTPDQKDEGKPSPTNVWKMYKAVDGCPTAPDGTKQISFYHDGVGTHPGFVDRIVNGLRMLFTRKEVRGSLWRGITGEGLDSIIRDCYTWLRKNYEPGDQIFVFGFSRGAYTVRSLAGFIRKCGILKPESEKSVEWAFEFYRGPIKPDDQPARDFRAANSYTANVWCIGVWDTVGALGIPLGGNFFKEINRNRQFHDVTLSSHVKHAYHAVAIDELRKPFSATLWEQQPGADQELEQVWFAGVHGDIGGGYADCGLSDVSFLWMAERAKRAGLALDDAYVTKTICNGRWDGVIHDSFGPPFDILGRHVRAIAAKRLDRNGTTIDTRERVDESALYRFGKIVVPATVKYAPPNLADYVRRFPTVPMLPPIARVAVPAGPVG